MKFKYILVFAISCIVSIGAENIVPIEIDVNSIPKDLLPKLIQSLEVNSKQYLNFSPALLAIDKSDDFREILMPKNLQEKNDTETTSTEQKKQDLKIKRIYKVDERSYLVQWGIDSGSIVPEQTSTSVWLRGKKSWYSFGTFVGLFQAIEKLNLERLKSTQSK